MQIDTQNRRWDPLDALAVSLQADAEQQVAELEALAGRPGAAESDRRLNLHAVDRRQ